MMAFVPAPSRRSFSVGHPVRGHFGNFAGGNLASMSNELTRVCLHYYENDSKYPFAGEGPTFEQDACIGRPIEDYISIYPMKKCRSHTSITQTAESNLDGAKSCGYVVTSAPENAFCVTDTDEDSGCCGKAASDEDVGCCCRSAVPPHLHHSATSSTAMSSMSGACSPPLPERTASKGDAPMRTAALLPPSASTHVLPKGGASTTAHVGAGNDSDDNDEEDANGCHGGGISGSDLMGAFGVFTTDQWAALQSAVSDGNPEREAAGTAEAAAPGSAPAAEPARATSTGGGASASAHPAIPRPLPAESLLRGLPVQLAGSDCYPAPSAPASTYPGTGLHLGPAPPSGGAAGGEPSSSGRPPDTNVSSEGTERPPSPGGSSSSIASLWAAVNGNVTSGVYDSTDDNVLAGQQRAGSHGWPGTAPVVTAGALRLAHVVGRPMAPHEVRSHHYARHAEPPYQAATRSYHAGAAEAGKAGGDGNRGDAPDSPVGVTPRSASCFTGSHFGLAREQLLQGYYSFQPDLNNTEGEAAEQLKRVRSQSRNSIDLMYPQQHPQPVYPLPQPYHSTTQQPQRHHHGASAMAAAGVPQPPKQQQSYHGPQLNPGAQPQLHYPQQPQQQQLLQGQHHYQHHPSYFQQQQLPQQPPPPQQLDSPSRRRNSYIMTLPGRTLSTYTTYGYRRARSSLAALEQTLPYGSGGTGGGAGSDDDDDDDTEEATRRITAAFRTHTGMTRSSGWGLLGPDTAPTTPTGEAAAVRRDPWVGALSCSNLGPAGGDRGGEGGGGSGVDKESAADGEDDAAGPLTRKRSSYHLTNSHAAVELFLRLNHARQTMDFVKRQTLLFANLDKAELTVWEALHLMDELREYEAVLMAEGTKEVQEVSELSLLEHAFQTAELCRLHHPNHDWLHLVGLIHGLGKLLAHRRFGSQPQWAICGETYPLGCRFSPHILGSQYFTANPDRRRRLYNTPTGPYGPGCGLLNVVMSWSAPEYLYLVLMLNSAPMPQDAVWILRHSKFLTLARPHSCYLPLCSSEDLRRLPLLRSFQSLASPYRCRTAELPEGFVLQGEERMAYYSALIAKYIGDGKLRW